MTVELIVVGAGGFGRETLDVIEAINRAEPERFKVVGIADDGPSEINISRLVARHYRMVGTLADVVRLGLASHYALAVGQPRMRRMLAARLEDSGMQPVSLIHPSSSVGSVREIGPGSIICGGVQISTNTRLGRHVHVNPGATVGHDAELDDFVSINPGAIISGEVRVAQESLVGAGAVVLQGLVVGAGSTVGASACVTRNVIAGTVVKGVPAR